MLEINEQEPKAIDMVGKGLFMKNLHTQQMLYKQIYRYIYFFFFCKEPRQQISLKLGALQEAPFDETIHNPVEKKIVHISLSESK